jgi:hypothetical protein
MREVNLKVLTRSLKSVAESPVTADSAEQKEQLVRDFLGQPQGWKKLAHAMIHPIRHNVRNLTTAEENRIETLVYLAVQNGALTNYASAERLRLEIQEKVVLARYK